MSISLIDQFTATEIGEYFFVPMDKFLKGSITKAAQTCRLRTGREFSYRINPTMSGYRIYVEEAKKPKEKRGAPRKGETAKPKKRRNSAEWTNMFL